MRGGAQGDCQVDTTALLEDRSWVASPCLCTPRANGHTVKGASLGFS